MSENNFQNMIRGIENSGTKTPSHETSEKPWVLAVVELFCQNGNPTREATADFAKRLMGGILGNSELRRWVCKKESASPHRLDDDPYGFGEPGMIMMGWLFANMDKVRKNTGRNGWEWLRQLVAAQPNAEAAEKTAGQVLCTVLKNTVRRELAKGSEDALLADRISKMLTAITEFVELTQDTWVLQGGETWIEDAGLEVAAFVEELQTDAALHPLIDRAEQRPERREMRAFLHAVWAVRQVALTTGQIKQLIQQFFGVVSDSARMTSIEELKERTGREPGEEDVDDLEDEDADEEEHGVREKVDEEDQPDPGEQSEELLRGASDASKKPISVPQEKAMELLLHVQAIDGGRLFHPIEKAKRGSISQEFLGYIVWVGRPLKDGTGIFGQQHYIETYGGKDTKRLSERLVDKLEFREKGVFHGWINTDTGREVLKPLLGLNRHQIEDVIGCLCDLLAAREPSWCPPCVQWPPLPSSQSKKPEVPNE